MKKIMKTVLYIMGLPIALFVVVLLCILYETNYKKTICDTSVSLDKIYKFFRLQSMMG